MGSDQREPSARGTAGTVTLVAGGLVLALLGVGWFVLSHFVMNTSTPDAVAESLGVMLALLIVASLVGAVTSGRGKPG